MYLNYQWTDTNKL